MTLFTVSGSIKNLFSIDYVNIYLFSVCLPKDFEINKYIEKVWGYSTLLIS